VISNTYLFFFSTTQKNSRKTRKSHLSRSSTFHKRPQVSSDAADCLRLSYFIIMIVIFLLHTKKIIFSRLFSSSTKKNVEKFVFAFVVKIKINSNTRVMNIFSYSKRKNLNKNKKLINVERFPLSLLYDYFHTQY
jgi:hypothetical protein